MKHGLYKVDYIDEQVLRSGVEFRNRTTPWEWVKLHYKGYRKEYKCGRIKSLLMTLRWNQVLNSWEKTLNRVKGF